MEQLKFKDLTQSKVCQSRDNKKNYVVYNTSFSGPLQEYKYVGENYGYEGLVFQRPWGNTVDGIAGKWMDGVYIPI